MPSSKQQYYFTLIKRWQKSGLSQKAWCEQHNCSYAVFQYWLRRFREHANEAVSLPIENSFVSLPMQESLVVAPWCELVLASGQKLLFHQPVAAAFIKSLLD